MAGNRIDQKAGDNAIQIGSVGDNVNVIVNPQTLSALSKSKQQALFSLLQNVKADWIEGKSTTDRGVLQSSLPNQLLLDLGKEFETETDVIKKRWHIEYANNRPRQKLAPEKSILEIFDTDAKKLLLILGEPGSGKTTTLLDLARHLIKRVEEDPDQPIPVIFNLSSWKEEQTLFEWLVQELSLRFSIKAPKKWREEWLENNRLILLLDGLDEVSSKSQTACIEAVNQFMNEYGVPGLVICCRRNEFLKLVESSIRLNVNAAITLQPLKFEQIDGYLEKLGPELEALRSIIIKNPDFKKLAKSPLMLNIMCMTYNNVPIEELERTHIDTSDTGRKQLFDKYIERMFSRITRATEERYPKKQTINLLTWLAHKITKHNNQIFFLIERLQPNWLSTYFWQIIYVFVSRLIGGMCIGLAMGALMGGARDGLIFGLVGGITVGCIDLVRLEVNEKIVGDKTRRTLWWKTVQVVIVWLIVAFMFHLTAGLLTDIRVLNMAVAWSIPFGGIFGSRGAWQTFENDIRIIEDLNWSIKRLMLAGLLGILLFGLFSGPATLLIFWLSSDEVMRGWILGSVEWLNFISSGDTKILLGSGLMFGTIVGGPVGLIFGGGPIGKILDLRSEEPTEYEKAVPNQGIRFSLKTALWSGAGFGLISWLIFAVIFLLFSGHIEAVFLSVYNGITIGILAALWFGGIDVIQHYVLRLILYIKGRTAFDYVKFLDYADERIFLERVGGSYKFKHNLLRDHFAAMAEPTINIVWKRVGGVTVFTSLVVISGTIVTLGWQNINFASGKSLGPDVLTYKRQISHYGQAEHFIDCMDQEDKIEVERGDTILVEASGKIKVGYFIGGVGPEGRHVAFLGFAPMNIYNRQADIPHGALMCRISDGTNERKWRNCALNDQYFDKFFQNPGTQFKASIDGCLDFAVNDTEQENNYGAFDVMVQIKK